MSKTVAIVQSAYIPWKGYFDIIASVDEFILFDDVQYVKRHWHNRNKIKTPQGVVWLTIPVSTKSRYHQTIEETLVSGSWAEKHWRTMHANYCKSPYFQDYRAIVEACYDQVSSEPSLTNINECFLHTICNALDIRTPIVRSSAYKSSGAKTEKLLSLCKAAGATRYLSGPTARDYFDTDLFKRAGIEVGWFDYSGYPEYPQVHGPFEHSVTIMDLLLNTGSDCRRYMKQPLQVYY